MFIGGGGRGSGGGRGVGEKHLKKVYHRKIDKIFKIFTEENNRLCGCQNSWKLLENIMTSLASLSALAHLQWLWLSRTSSRRFLQLGLKEMFMGLYYS